MTNEIYCKSIRLNLVISSYSLLLISRLVSKKKTQETNNLNYFLYNSISFNLYKKILNKYSIAAIAKNKGKVGNFKPNSLTVDLHKRYASFGKLTWYWLFRMVVNSRFLLNYKEFKNYFAKNTFLKYESSLLLYDKKYNLWKKYINTHMENTLPLHRYTSKKKRKITGMRLYNFPTKIKKRKRSPKYGRLDSFIFSKKNKLNFKFIYKDRKRYKRRFGINHRCLIKNKLIRNLRFFLRKKHHRRYSLKPKKWALKKAKKNLLKRIRRKLKIRQINLRLIKNETGLSLGYFFAKSTLRVKKAKNSLEKALWLLKAAKNAYFGNISKSFKRKRLNNNLLLLRNSKNNINLFLKKNKKNIKKLFTSYLFPRNVVDMGKRSNFESIVFDKNTSEIKDIGITTKITPNFKNLTAISEVKYSKLCRAIALKKNKGVVLSKINTMVKKKRNKEINIPKKNVILVEKKIKKNNFFKKNLKKKSVEFLDKIYFLKKTKVIANSFGGGVVDLKKHKAFINFFYKKKIKILKAFNLKNLKIQNFRFMLNKKRLNTVITNIFMENFLIDYFYSNICEKRASNLMRGSNSRYFKFILLLKKLYKKKQARKPYQNLTFKRKKKLKNFLKKKKRLKYFLKTNYKFLPDYQKKLKSLLNYLFPGSNKELKVNKLRILRRISFWNESTGCYNIRMRRGFRLKLRFKRFRKILFWKKKIRALSFWSKLSKFRHKNISFGCPKLKRKSVLFDLKWKNLIQPLLQFEKTKILYSNKTYPRFFKKVVPGGIANLRKKQICNLLGTVLKQKKIKLLITKPRLVVVALPMKKIYKKNKLAKKTANFNKALKKILEKKTDKNKQKPVKLQIGGGVNGTQINKNIKKKTNKNKWLLWKSNKKWSKKIIKNHGFRAWELYKKKMMSKKKTLNLVYRKLKRFTNKRGVSASFYKKNFILKFLNFKFKNFKFKNSIRILKNKIRKNQELFYFLKLKIKKQFFFKILKQCENSKVFKNRLKFFKVKKKKIIKKKLKLLKKINKYSDLKFLVFFLKKIFIKPSAKNFLYLKFLMATSDKKILLLKRALQDKNLKLLRFGRSFVKTQKNYKDLIKSLRLKFYKKKLFSKFVKRLKSRILINKKYNFRKKIICTLKSKTKIKKIIKNNDCYIAKKKINLQKLKNFASKIGVNGLVLLKKKNEINLNSKSILIKRVILSSNYTTGVNCLILKKNEINSKKKLKLNTTLKYPTIFKKETKVIVFGFGKNKWKYFIKNSKKQNMKKFNSFSPEIKNLSDMLKNVKLKAFSINKLVSFGLKNSIFFKKINNSVGDCYKKNLLFQTVGRAFELGILVNPNRNITRFVSRQRQKNMKKNVKISKTKLSQISKIIKQESQVNKKNIIKYIRLNWKKKIKIYDFFRKKNKLVPESKIFKKKIKKKAENIGWVVKSKFLMQYVRRSKWQLFLKTSEISQTNNFLSKIRKFNFLKVLKKSKNYKKTIRKNKIFLKKIKRYSRRIFRLSRFSIRRAVRRKLTKLSKSSKIQTNALRSIRRRNRRIFYLGRSKKKKFYRQLKNDKKTKYRILKKKKLLLLQMYKKLPKKIKIGIYQKIKMRNIRKNNNKRAVVVSKKPNMRRKSKLYKKITKKLKKLRFKKITSRRYAINKKWQKIHFSAKFLKKSNNIYKLKNRSNYTNSGLKATTTNLNYLWKITKRLNNFETSKLRAILPFNFDCYFLKTQNSNIKIPSKLKSFWIHKINKLSNTSLLKNYGVKNKVLKKSKSMPKLVMSLIKTVRSNIKSRRALFLKTPKFAGATRLKKNRLTLRLKLKKMFNMRKGCYLKKQTLWVRCRKFRKKWRFRSYFWRKLRKGIKSVIIGRLNDNIWYKKRGKWFEHLRKSSKHRKFKNFWIKERWREYGKRRFPKDWYKVRRRKFPLKSGKKNWSLKITKHYNFFYFRFIRNQSTYDSSYAYFDYLSILGRHNKKIRNSGKYKLARRTEHLVHFPWETTPNFYKIMGFKKKKKFWNKISSYRKYIYGLSRKGIIDLKSLFTPSADSFGIKKYSLVKNSAFKKSMQVFINSWNNYLDSRFTLFTVSSKLWFAKMNNVLKYTGIQTKKVWSANRVGLPFEHTVDLKLSKLKKYNYGVKTTIMLDKLTRVNLNNALDDVYFNFKRASLVSAYDLACKSNFRVFRAYSLGNYSFTKNKLYRLGYSEFASIFVDNAITTVKVSKLYKAYRAIIPQLRTNFYKSGGVSVKRDFFFTKRLKGARYRAQFIQKIPKFIKKNFWVFNSFEINKSGTFSSNL